MVEKATTTSIDDILRTLGSAINTRAHRTEDRLGDSALHIAIRKERLDLIIRLLQANANFELSNSNYESPLTLMEHSPQPYIRALANLLRVRIKLAYLEKASKSSASYVESYQSNIDKINTIMSDFPEDKYRPVRDYICYELGMRLARFNDKQPKFDTLQPIHPVQAYNFLNRVTVHFGVKQFSVINTILFLLIKERHVNSLKKHERYPEGPFIAFKKADASEKDQGKLGKSKEHANTKHIDLSGIKALDDPEEDDLDAGIVSEESHISVTNSYEMNRKLTMALLEHHMHSGPENPDKKLFLDAIIAFIIDRSCKLKSIPGFKNFTDITSLRLLFDKLAVLRQDEIIHTEQEVSRIKNVSAKKLADMAYDIELLEAKVLEYKRNLAKLEASAAATKDTLDAAASIITPASIGLMQENSGATPSYMTFAERPGTLIFLGPN